MEDFVVNQLIDEGGARRMRVNLEEEFGGYIGPSS